jgi:hypothetical protein
LRIKNRTLSLIRNPKSRLSVSAGDRFSASGVFYETGLAHVPSFGMKKSEFTFFHPGAMSGRDYS